jgi:hypothetical protein
VLAHREATAEQLAGVFDGVTRAAGPCPCGACRAIAKARP